MLTTFIAIGLGRLAAQKLATLDVKGLAKGVETVRRAAITVTVGPAAGAFGAGVAVGTGLGMLLAPRAGRESRKLATDRLSVFGHQVLESLRTEAASSSARAELLSREQSAE